MFGLFWGAPGFNILAGPIIFFYPNSLAELEGNNFLDSFNQGVHLALELLITVAARNFSCPISSFLLAIRALDSRAIWIKYGG